MSWVPDALTINSFISNIHIFWPLLKITKAGFILLAQQDFQFIRESWDCESDIRAKTREYSVE